jgi:hypothetical protein
VKLINLESLSECNARVSIKDGSGPRLFLMDLELIGSVLMTASSGLLCIKMEYSNLDLSSVVQHLSTSKESIKEILLFNHNLELGNTINLSS